MVAASENSHVELLKNDSSWQVLKFLTGMSAHHPPFRAQ